MPSPPPRASHYAHNSPGRDSRPGCGDSVGPGESVALEMQDRPANLEFYAAAGVASFGSIFPFTVRRRSVRSHNRSTYPRVLCKLDVKITDSLGSVSAPSVAGRFTVSAARLAYLDVRDSCATVTGAFQTQLFINIVGNVFGVTFMMLSAFNALMSDGTSTVQITLYFLYDSLMRTLQMYFIIDACHTTVEQANTINITFQKKINEFHHINTIKRKVQLFILEMLDHKIEFIIYGFICLDFEMFVSIMGTIATYLLILVQLGSTPNVLDKTSNATNVTTASTEHGVFTTIKPS